MVPKTVLPNSEYTLDEKATGEIFFQNPDALHELNRVMATKCADIALALVHLRKQLSNIAGPFRPLLGDLRRPYPMLT